MTELWCFDRILHNLDKKAPHALHPYQISPIAFLCSKLQILLLRQPTPTKTTLRCRTSDSFLLRLAIPLYRRQTKLRNYEPPPTQRKRQILTESLASSTAAFLAPNG
jgi:hypothetical protein